VNFSPNILNVTGAPSNASGAFARLGLAFGEGNSFWGKSSVLELTHVGYDLTTLSNGFVTYFPRPRQRLQTSPRSVLTH